MSESMDNYEKNVYCELLDETTAQITIIDAETYRILYANKSALDKTSDMPGHYIGSVCYEFITHGSEPCGHCMIKTAEKGEYKSRIVEFASRQYRQLYKIVDWNGRKAMMEYTEDITEQMQNLTYARQEKDLMSLILNSIPVGICVFQYEDGQVRLLDINSTMREFLHIESKSPLNNEYEAILRYAYEEDIPAVRAAGEQLAVPGTREYFEFRLAGDPPENRRWMGAHAQSLATATGAVYIYIGYTDITRQKHAMQTQLELDSTRKANTAITEFYSRMSHDIRTPMNGILGLADLSMDENNIDVIKDNMKKIRSAGKYLLSLVNDTLDFQKIQSGNMILEPDIVYTGDIFDDICSIIREAADKKGITFKTVNDNADINQYIRADKVRLKQVFINILSNAVKFTPPGGTVELRYGLIKREGMISHDIITFTDTGIGMSRDFLENGIFRPFHQEHGAGVGTGLGLSIVKKLVELMNGRLEVESEQGTGTTFTLYLDFERVDNEEARQYLQKQKVGKYTSYEKLNGRRVLLAEDHPLNAEITTKLLNKFSCQVVWAHNGKECVELYNQSQPGEYDAILMDIRMPEMNGIEAARTIRLLERADAAEIPIIAMSANAYDTDIQNSIEAGMNAHLSKPIEPDKMYETIIDYIN